MIVLDASAAVELVLRTPLAERIAARVLDPAQQLVRRIWSLRAAMSAYDGAYVALAEALAAPLLTCDERLARTHGHGADTELIAPKA